MSKTIIIDGAERATPAIMIRRGDALYGYFHAGTDGRLCDEETYWGSATPEVLAAIEAAGVRLEVEHVDADWPNPGYGNRPGRKCECCGLAPATVEYGSHDCNNHERRHHVCEPCNSVCATDPHSGNPIHVPATEHVPVVES